MKAHSLCSRQIVEDLRKKSNWSDNLLHFAWRIDLKTKAKSHTEVDLSASEPTAIVEFTIGKEGADVRTARGDRIQESARACCVEHAVLCCVERVRAVRACVRVCEHCLTGCLPPAVPFLVFAALVRRQQARALRDGSCAARHSAAAARGHRGSPRRPELCFLNTNSSSTTDHCTRYAPPPSSFSSSIVVQH